MASSPDSGSSTGGPLGLRFRDCFDSGGGVAGVGPPSVRGVVLRASASVSSSSWMMTACFSSSSAGSGGGAGAGARRIRRR